MKIGIIRIAAYGDNLIISPFIRYLKSQGHTIDLLTSEQGLEVFENNPHIDKLIYHKKDSIENDKLGEYFEKIKKDNGWDICYDLCESIEVRLALHPSYPQWNWSKEERRVHCNHNYYEYMFQHAGITVDWYGIKDLNSFYVPEMFFTQKEEDFIFDIRKECLGHKIIMWGLSGSGRHKTYPYVPYIIGDIMREFPKVMIILVGGETCKILECAIPKHKRILKKSGEFTFRQSALMSKYSNLVVSPDTGFLHAAGCWDTPKIGLITNTSKENITKHFKNDYSIESQAVCAPCFRIPSEPALHCPTELASNACLCMGKDAIKPELVLERIKDVIGRD